MYVCISSKNELRWDKIWFDNNRWEKSMLLPYYWNDYYLTPNNAYDIPWICEQSNKVSCCPLSFLEYHFGFGLEPDQGYVDVIDA